MLVAVTTLHYAAWSFADCVVPPCCLWMVSAACCIMLQHGGVPSFEGDCLRCLAATACSSVLY